MKSWWIVESTGTQNSDQFRIAIDQQNPGYFLCRRVKRDDMGRIEISFIAISSTAVRLGGKVSWKTAIGRVQRTQPADPGRATHILCWE